MRVWFNVTVSTAMEILKKKCTEKMITSLVTASMDVLMFPHMVTHLLDG